MATYEFLVPRVALSENHIQYNLELLLINDADTYKFLFGYTYIFRRLELAVIRTGAGTGGNINIDFSIYGWARNNVMFSPLTYKWLTWAGGNEATCTAKWGDYISGSGNTNNDDRDFNYEEFEPVHSFDGFHITISGGRGDPAAVDNLPAYIRLDGFLD